MSNDIAYIIFYSELQQGVRSCGGQKKRFKDCLTTNLKKCDIQPNDLEALAADRSGGTHSAKT